MSQTPAPSMPESVNFPVDEIVHCMGCKFPKNLNRIYYFLKGDPKWKTKTEGFALGLDTFVTISELLQKRISPNQLEVLNALRVVYLHKVHNRFKRTVSDKRFQKNVEVSFQWFLTEARKCFKTITVNSASSES